MVAMYEKERNIQRADNKFLIEIWQIPTGDHTINITKFFANMIGIDKRNLRIANREDLQQKLP